MKIIAVGMNYAAHNKELHHSLKLSEPTIFMKSDSSLLKDGKPFFIPDFSSEIHYETEIVVKIDRLGKNIAERFAHRYYNEELTLQPAICKTSCVRKVCLGKSARRSIIRLFLGHSSHWSVWEM